MATRDRIRVMILHCTSLRSLRCTRLHDFIVVPPGRRPNTLQVSWLLAYLHGRPRHRGGVVMVPRAACAHARHQPGAAAWLQPALQDAGLHKRVVHRVGEHRGYRRRVCVPGGRPEQTFDVRHCLEWGPMGVPLAPLYRSRIQHRDRRA